MNFNNRDFKGIWIPKELWMDSNLSLIEKCLLVEIDSLDNEYGCFASNDYFAKFFGLTTRSISNYITRLKKLGMITSEIVDDKRILRIFKNQPLEENENHEVEELEELEKLEELDILDIKDNKKEPKEPKEPKKIKENKKENKIDFNSFWISYPKKVNRKKSEAKWNKLTFEVQSKIIKDLPKRKIGEKWKSEDGKYIENPTTYLSGERWEDDIKKLSDSKNKLLEVGDKYSKYEK